MVRLEKARISKSRIAALTKDGNFLEIDRRAKHIGTWYTVPEEAAEHAAQILRERAREVFGKGGQVGPHGAWKPNTPETVRWKGHDVVMRGRTRTMVEAVKNMDVKVGFGGRKGRAVRFVGIDDQSPHPDSGQSTATGGRLTVTEMFILHEFGSGDGHVPARPWLSRVADADGPRALDAAVWTIGFRLSKDMTVLDFPGAGPAHFPLIGRAKEFPEDIG